MLCDTETVKRLLGALRTCPGKNKSIQYKIASDINNQIIDNDTNAYDMIQSYCADIAAVGDGRQGQVNAVESSEGCTYCKIRGHKEDDCRRKKADERARGRSAGGGRFRGDCHWFGKPGHRESECRKKQSGQPSVQGTQQPQSPQPQPVANVNNQQTTPTSSAPVTAVNQSSIQALINHLQSTQKGINHVNMIRTAHGTLKTQTQTQTAAEQAASSSAAADADQLDQRSPAVAAAGLRNAQCESPYKELDHNPFAVLATCTNEADDKPRILLSLCDGAGCAGMAARNCGMTFDRYIAAENDDVTTIVSDNCNGDHMGQGVPAPDHYWNSNVEDIQEKDIAELGQDNIKLLTWGAPCEDMSLLRLLRKPSASDSECSLRPGLKGPKGRVFLKCIEITQWVLLYNPDCELLIENVVFKDLKEDWGLVCKALGEPMIINSALVSFTKRNRAWWCNFKNLPSVLTEVIADRTSLTHQAPECMDQGRSVQTCQAYGVECIHPICKGWSGSDESPWATTGRPVLVRDEMHEQLQHLRPHEAEKLMGTSGDDTAGMVLTAKERLKAIGNAWDMNVANMLFSYSAQATRTPPQSLRPNMEHIKTPSMSTAVLAAEAISTMEDLTDDEREQQAILILLIDSAPGDLADVITQARPEEQTLYLALNKHHFSNSVLIAHEGAVLDSGSSKHLDTRVFAPNSDDVKSLTGFDNSQQWTEGNGHLPLTITDHATGKQA